MEDWYKPIEIQQKTNPQPAQKSSNNGVRSFWCNHIVQLEAMKIICMGSHSLQFLSITLFTHTDIHVGIHSSGHVRERRKIVRFWCQREMQFSLSLPPYTSFLPINTWQRGDEKSRIKTNEFRFRRANFIQRTSQVLPSIPRTTLNHYVYYYGLCYLFNNVNREWMPACSLRPIKISICRAEYQRTRHTETSVTYRCLEACIILAKPLVANQSWLLNCTIITDLQIGNGDCTV